MNEKDKTVVLPLIRQVLPTLIANALVNVQPMSLPSGNIFTFKNTFKYTFRIIDQTILDTGEVWYLAHVTDNIKEWIVESFVNNINYKHNDDDNFMRITEEVLILLKLKWS